MGRVRVWFQLSNIYMTSGSNQVVLVHGLIHVRVKLGLCFLGQSWCNVACNGSNL